MRALWIAVVSATLAACSAAPTSEQSPADVEDAKAKAAAGAQGQGVPDRQVSRVDITGKGAGKSPLTDPSNILSRRSIYYEYDQFDVKEQYKPLVEAHARYLRDNPKSRILIQGNTDERGSREYNVGLGQRRSDGVKSMLKLLGAREDQIESVSLGEEKPKSDGHDESAWSQNRRSDILYQGEY
jgi:peptidoglycan-associated lipoprotein